MQKIESSHKIDSRIRPAVSIAYLGKRSSSIHQSSTQGVSTKSAKRLENAGFTQSKQDLAVRGYQPEVPEDIMKIFLENSEALNDFQLR